MDKLAQAAAPWVRIDLAREPDFAVGGLHVRPSRRHVEAAGVRHVLQRRVMQVLVALAHSSSEVVSQHELVARCWDGLTVSDDAIGRCIAQLRRLAASWAKPPFVIETIAGVGYRLEAVGETAADTRESTSRRRPWAVAAVAMLVLVALAVAAAWLMRSRPSWPAGAEARIAVLPFDASGEGAKPFADALLDQIVGGLSESQIEAVSPTVDQRLPGPQDAKSIGRLGAGLLLDGAVNSDGKTMDIRFRLEDARERLVIWSEEFHGPAGDPAALQAAVVAHVADVAYWAKVGRSGKVKLDASTLSEFIAGRESTTGVRNDSNAAALAAYQSVAVAAPDFSWGHSGVAVTDAFSLFDEQAPAESLRADARREAARALSLDPHNGEAYLALELAAPRLDWRQREALLLQGAAADPGFEPGALMEGRLQWYVGRGRSALPWFERAHAANPLHDGANWTLALNAASEGYADESRGVLAQMQTQWPEAPSTKLARFMVAVVKGANTEALALLADPATRPPILDQRAAEAWRAALAAEGETGATAHRAAVAAVRSASKAGSLSHGQALMLLAMLGDLDGAFDEASLYVPADPYEPPYLFLPPTARMRNDRRFMPVARKLGLIDYWTSTNKWPDFCSDPTYPLDCRAEARRVAALTSAQP